MEEEGLAIDEISQNPKWNWRSRLPFLAWILGKIMENSFLYLRGVLGSMAKCIFFTQFVDFLFRSILQSLRTSLGVVDADYCFVFSDFFLQGNRYTFQGDLKGDLHVHGCV